MRLPHCAAALVVLAFAPRASAQLAVIGDDAAPAIARDLLATGQQVIPPNEAVALLRQKAAVGSSDTARDLARSARAAYAGVRYPEAVSSLERAVDELVRAEALGADRNRLLASMLLELGVVRMADADVPGGASDVRLAMRLDPDVALDETVHGPDVQRAVARLRSAQRRESVVRRTLEASTPGAVVWLDGHALGPSPIHAVPMAHGPHLIEARSPDHGNGAVRVDAAANLSGAIRVDLAPPTDAARALRALQAAEWASAARHTLAALALEAVIVVERAGGSVVAERWNRGGTRFRWTPTAEGGVGALARSTPPQPPIVPSSSIPAVPLPGPRPEPPPAPSRRSGVSAVEWAGITAAVLLALAGAAALVLAPPDE